MPDSDSQPPNLVDFLLRLHENPELLAEFNKGPDKVMTDAGITSKEDRQILKSGDLLNVRKLLARELK
jgi:hypothetical protein